MAGLVSAMFDRWVSREPGFKEPAIPWDVLCIVHPARVVTHHFRAVQETRRVAEGLRRAFGSVGRCGVQIWDATCLSLTAEGCARVLVWCIDGGDDVERDAPLRACVGSAKGVEMVIVLAKFGARNFAERLKGRVPAIAWLRLGFDDVPRAAVKVLGPCLRLAATTTSALRLFADHAEEFCQKGDWKDFGVVAAPVPSRTAVWWKRPSETQLLGAAIAMTNLQFSASTARLLRERDLLTARELVQLAIQQCKAARASRTYTACIGAFNINPTDLGEAVTAAACEALACDRTRSFTIVWRVSSSADTDAFSAAVLTLPENSFGVVWFDDAHLVPRVLDVAQHARVAIVCLYCFDCGEDCHAICGDANIVSINIYDLTLDTTRRQDDDDDAGHVVDGTHGDFVRIVVPSSAPGSNPLLSHRELERWFRSPVAGVFLDDDGAVYLRVAVLNRQGADRLRDFVLERRGAAIAGWPGGSIHSDPVQAISPVVKRAYLDLAKRAVERSILVNLVVRRARVPDDHLRLLVYAYLGQEYH